jgi:hypothetical protein
LATARKVGLATCALLALYLLLSPVYALVNYEAFGSETRQFVRYIVVPGALAAAILAAGILARPQWSAVIGISGLGALLGLFACEALLTVPLVSVRLAMLGQLSSEKQAAIARDGAVIQGFTLQRLNRMSGTNKLSTAILSGFPNTQVILCTPQDEPVIYTSDRYGFNNPDPVYDARMELMLLGDSFVEGFCLPPGEDLASRLRDHGIVAASMGIRGNGPLLELATLGRFGTALRPQEVVMAFFEGNDWENLAAEMRQPWLREALHKNAEFGSQALAGEPLQKARTALEKASRDPITFGDLLTRTEMVRNFFALQLTLTNLGLVYPKIAGAIPEFRDTLRQARHLTEGWGGRFTLAYVPRVDRFMGQASADPAFDQLRKQVLEAAAAEGIPVIDLYETFRDEPQPMRMYAADSHFSAEGAKVAAAAIVQKLASRQQPKDTNAAAARQRP